MNKAICKIAAATALLISCSMDASAQASASSNASATIITPITITKTTDMNFGNVAVSALTPGTVVMSPAAVRSATGGVTLPATSGTVAAASFTVNGQSGYTYAITLPSAVTLTSAANSMTVTNFTSTPTTTGTLTGGTQTLNVGGTLNVIAGQAPGLYTSATPFVVTVNYN